MGKIDPRNEDLGYICFMRENVKKNHFFDWFYNHITYPTILAIKIKHAPTFYTTFEDNHQSTIKFVLWGDSDIPYLQQMTEPMEIQDSMLRGLYFQRLELKLPSVSNPFTWGHFSIY